MTRLYCLLLGALVTLPVYSQEGKPLRVVELYTSQGCYSCPPADTFLETLSQQENTITLSCHVTYWDYLGWKDTFSRQFCDNRQRQYQSLLKQGSRVGVYTPQMIVNGRYGGVGSRQGFIRQLLRVDQQTQAPLQLIQLAMANTTTLDIQLPALLAKNKSSPDKALTLWLLGTTGQHLLPIGSGENSGKHLPYTNPIEWVVNLGAWDGSSQMRQHSLTAIKTETNNSIKDWIVLVQLVPLGEIVAAGRLSLTPSEKPLAGTLP